MALPPPMPVWIRSFAGPVFAGLNGPLSNTLGTVMGSEEVENGYEESGWGGMDHRNAGCDGVRPANAGPAPG